MKIKLNSPQKQPDVEIWLPANQASLVKRFFAKIDAPKIREIVPDFIQQEVRDLGDEVIYPIYDFLDDHKF